MDVKTTAAAVSERGLAGECNGVENWFARQGRDNFPNGRFSFASIDAVLSCSQLQTRLS